MKLVEGEISLESTYENVPKILHWFEWGKNKLGIYDIVQNKNKIIDLEEEFKVPCFSRSILTKDGRIYLIGGEQPEYFARKEVYCYDLEKQEFQRKQNMLSKKYDFSICNILNEIYVICGKDNQNIVTNICEKYDIDKDTWVQISNTNIKRYAATAVSYNDNKIYLFGGRGEQNHEMISQIEEYNLQDQQWNIIEVKINQQLYQPVEVCAGIQISHSQILIFGGSEAQLQDTSSTLIFEVEQRKFIKKNDLLKQHIFVQQPFLYGQYVYAVGNEYYIKQRNLHQYIIEKDQWNILF